MLKKKDRRIHILTYKDLHNKLSKKTFVAENCRVMGIGEIGLEN